MKNKILSVVFILSLVLLPSNVALAGGGGGITSIGKIFAVVVAVYLAYPLLIQTALGVSASTAGWIAVGAGAAVGVGYVQCAGGQNNVSFDGCGGSSGGGGGSSGSSGSGANTSQ
ncbi:MAG: hypothetical protein AAB858_00035, partial [Patescibacteria group bacterium]